MSNMLGSPETLAQRAAQLADRATGPRPESWRPEKPELEHPNPIVGVLLRIVDGPDRGYGPTKIAELKDPAGVEWAVWLLGHVLQQEFLERTSAPAAGELVAIHYQGRRRRQGARPGEPAEYESYRVVVDRQAGEQRPERPLATFARAPSPESSPSVLEEVRCEQCGGLEPEHEPWCVPF